MQVKTREVSGHEIRYKLLQLTPLKSNKEPHNQEKNNEESVDVRMCNVPAGILGTENLNCILPEKPRIRELSSPPQDTKVP